jgi:hypothetical protein
MWIYIYKIILIDNGKIRASGNSMIKWLKLNYKFLP